MYINTNRYVGGLTCLVLAFAAAGLSAQDSQLIAGQNINVVSGTEWPNGDPFLQRQNEPTIAVSTRNVLNLLGGSNDYRTVDLPGLLGGKTTGDSWLSVYTSNDGGGRWQSTLLPAYPQDISALGVVSPIKGFDAAADPVIRAGTHGLFYYSGIAFNGGDNAPSAGFVATYMDLNNDERKSSIGYVRTALFDANPSGTFFVDKPWIAVDKPRTGAMIRIFDVTTDDDVISQTVECGNLYAVWARIEGDGTTAIRSQIMFARSEDCGETFTTPLQLSLDNTINQGATVAVEPFTGRVQVAWRQFENATMNCTRKAGFWRNNPQAWPVDELELAGNTVSKENGGTIIVPVPAGDDDGDDDNDIWDDDAETPGRVFRQLLAAWLNTLSGADSSAITQKLVDAEAWLIDNPLGTEPENGAEEAGNKLRNALRRYNKGIIGPGLCDDMTGSGMLSGLNPDAIIVVSSDDAGNTFSSPVSVTGPDYFPFEQGTSEFSFRTTGFATMIFDGEGRSYIAYSTRGVAVPDADPVGGDARIVVTTSMDGTTWTLAQPIDEPSVPGHQLMPAFEFARGDVFLLYYDFREDISGVFDRFIVDLPVDLTTLRHSADVRGAQASAADIPVFTDYSILDIPSTQASRYPFVIFDDAGMPFSQQMQYNPPNLPMFRGGTVPFFGDYVDLAALRFFVDETGTWDFDLDPARGSSVLHAVWTDNRDVIGPPDGDWLSYVPPGDGSTPTSLFDPTQTVPACSPGDDPTVVDRTKMRNQNIYTARLTQGLSFAVPGNNRPLGTIQRVFVGFLQNLTDEDKLFRLQILNQPVGGSASFDQFSLETQRDQVVERQSSNSRSIFVTSTDPSASVDISVVEIDPATSNPAMNGLTATTRINADPSAPVPDDNNILSEEVYTPAVFNPAVFNPAVFNAALLGTGDVGIYNPAVFNPAVFNDPVQAEFVQAVLAQLAILNPAVFNPAVFNPAVFNPAVFNPAVFNPAVFNPAVFNPAVFNPAVFNVSTANPAVFNPAVFNPAVFNGAIVETVETSVVIENNGNATAAYSLNLDLQNPPVGFLFQIMIYKTYLVPSVDGCTLTETVEQEALVSELQPDVNGSLLNPDSTSFFVAPGDNVVVTVRVVPDPSAPGNTSTIDTLAELDLSQSVVQQAVDTEGLANGETEPEPVVILAPSLPPLVIDTTGLPNGSVGASYGATLTTSGGGGSPVVWSVVPGTVLPAGLSLTMGGQIVGAPTTQGVFAFDVRAKDDDQVTERSFSITITPASVALISQNSAFGANTITLDTATGLKWLDVTLSTPYSYDQILVQLQSGGVFDGYRLATNAEVLTFWQNAGINTGAGFLGFFTSQNFQPIVDLMAFVGITGLNTGNLGGGNFFDFTVGHIESGPGSCVGICVTVAGLGADPDPTVTGRPSFGGVTSNNPNTQHGAWLISDLPLALVNVALTTTTLNIGGPTVSYTASIDNSTVSTASVVVLQAFVDQPGASRAAGGLLVPCGPSLGDLAPGPCNVNFTVIASNSTAGSGTLTPGPAIARFELRIGIGGTVLDTFSVPVTLVP